MFEIEKSDETGVNEHDELVKVTICDLTKLVSCVVSVMDMLLQCT